MNPTNDRIQGWGADLNPAMRPGVPKERVPARPIGVHWQSVERQKSRVEILRSNERAGITPVFGSTLPPKNMSGVLRRTAFKFSENDLRHWLILLFADRINVIEGIFEDLLKGRVPNFFAEAGWKGELKHNPKGVILRASLYAAITAGAIYYLTRKRRHRI